MKKVLLLLFLAVSLTTAVAQDKKPSKDLALAQRVFGTEPKKDKADTASTKVDRTKKTPTTPRKTKIKRTSKDVTSAQKIFGTTPKK